MSNVNSSYHFDLVACGTQLGKCFLSKCPNIPAIWGFFVVGWLKWIITQSTFIRFEKVSERHLKIIRLLFLFRSQSHKSQLKTIIRVNNSITLSRLDWHHLTLKPRNQSINLWSASTNKTIADCYDLGQMCAANTLNLNETDASEGARCTFFWGECLASLYLPSRYFGSECICVLAREKERIPPTNERDGMTWASERRIEK